MPCLCRIYGLDASSNGIISVNDKDLSPCLIQINLWIGCGKLFAFASSLCISRKIVCFIHNKLNRFAILSTILSIYPQE